MFKVKCINIKNTLGEKIAKQIEQYSLAYQKNELEIPPFRITEIEHYSLICYLQNKIYVDDKKNKISTYMGIELQLVEVINQ